MSSERAVVFLRNPASVVTAILLYALYPVPAGAQTNAETNAPGLQLNFSVPGARSLAMGGAFLGLADDATAAYANPAGLTNLSRAEISVEVRRWNLHHFFTDRTPESDSGQRSVENQITDPSFFSLVYPRRKVSFAFFGHKLANFESRFQTKGATVAEATRLFPTDTRLNLSIDTLGLAAAVEVVPWLSLGATYSYYDLKLDSLTKRFSLEALGSLPDPAEDKTHDFQTQKGDQDQWGGSVGFLVRPWRRVSFGGLYREGVEFDIEARSFNGRQPPPGRTPGSLKNEAEGAKFRVPEVRGLGVALRATALLTFTVDRYWIAYSEFEKVVDIFGLPADIFDPKDIVVEDGEEWHLGAEYYFLGANSLGGWSAGSKHPFFLRAGYWEDAEHGLLYRGTNTAFKTVFRERAGVSADHWSLGLGLSFRKLQLDTAIDWSDRVTTVSISTVVRI